MSEVVDMYYNLGVQIHKRARGQSREIAKRDYREARDWVHKAMNRGHQKAQELYFKITF